MSELLSSVSDHLLAPGGVTIESLQGVLGDLAGPGIDAADLYFQGQISESWALEDGIVKEGSFNLDQGVGVRAQSGEKTGFAYSNAITADALRQAAQAARSIARSGQQGQGSQRTGEAQQGFEHGHRSVSTHDTSRFRPGRDMNVKLGNTCPLAINRTPMTQQAKGVRISRRRAPRPGCRAGRWWSAR